MNEEFLDVKQRFTFKERQLIEGYLKEGLSYAEIGKSLCRSKSTVFKEVSPMGKEEYTAEKGQEIQDNSRGNKASQFISFHKILIRYEEMSKRVENLEMQVEILTDFIKGIGTK